MKSIKLPDKMVTIDGIPMRVDKEPVDLPQLVKLLLYNLPLQSLTMQDALLAKRVIDALTATKDGTLALEDADYDWLMKQVNDCAPKIFGVQAVMLKLALEGLAGGGCDDSPH